MVVTAIVLAAGEGTRMRSERPKPLHVLCGRPMLLYVLNALADIDCERTVVVVGHGAERVTKRMQEEAANDLRLEFVEQVVQRGTGDAVGVGLTAYADQDPDDDEMVLVLPGDTPLLRSGTLSNLVEAQRIGNAAATVLTARLADPTGYGRIVRGKDGRVRGIVEQRDATDDEVSIEEINTGIYCFRRNLLGPALRRVSPDNAQGEYYLTDVIKVLATAGHKVAAMVLDDPSEASGVNDRIQLAEAEAELRRRTNARWLAAGVTMFDPAQTFIDTTVELGRDVTLLPGTILQGRTVVGSGCELGPGTRLVDTKVGQGSTVENTVARGAEIGEACRVGPFAVLEPGDSLPSATRTGPFYAPGRSA
jgi:bifunctional UDP-N-acetylglucosamine pyrophosphorylase / glucosamine-1-phosphate N-acetyltransferase